MSMICSNPTRANTFSQVSLRPLQNTSSCVPVGLNLRKPLAVKRNRKPFLTQAASSLDIDVEKEESLKYRRVVFDFDRWAEHRSTSRYWRHLSTMLGSRIVRGLRYPLLIEGLLATFLCAYEQLYQQGNLPAYMPDLAVDISLPFGLSSAILSLLLVFRTGASYGRFDEARKFWGGVVNRSRDFTRQGTAYMDPETEKETIAMLGRWMIAFPWSMMCHLRAGEDVAKELKDHLTPAELDYLVSTPHRPNTVLQMLSKIVHTSSLPQDKKFRMDENLTLFADMLGASERILRTPIPVSYTRHTSRFLIMWLFFLPMSIFPQAGWATVPSSVLIAFVLLAIEEIGVQVEEPFSVLPLAAISSTITANVKHHLTRELPLMDSQKQAVEEALTTALPPAGNGGSPPAGPSGADFIAKLEEQIAAPAAAVATQVIDRPTPTPTPTPTTEPVAAVTNGAANGTSPAPAPAPTPATTTPAVVKTTTTAQPKPAPTTTPSDATQKPYERRVNIAPAGVRDADVSGRPLSRFDRKLREYFEKRGQD